MNIFTRVFPCLVSVILLGMATTLPGAGPAVASSRRQSWTGYLLDGVCAKERFTESSLGEKHTRKCLEMPICERSGFGVLLDGNRYLRFDNAGNQKVRKMLPAMTQEDKIRIRISGTLHRDRISVYSLDLEQ